LHALKLSVSWRQLMTQTYASSTACIERYLKEIGEYDLLSREEELDLAHRALTGEVQARQQMVQANLRLVVKIALEYVGIGLPLPDLISEGNIGLVRASELYDPKYGAKFSTYAALWIKQRMRRAITNQGKAVRVPIWKAQMLRRLQVSTDELTSQLGRKPTDSEISEGYGVSFTEMEKIRDGVIHVNSLDAPLGHDEDSESTMGTLLPDEQASDPSQNIAKEEFLEEAVASLNDLDDKELKILAMRFGLNGQEEQTLEVIGKGFNVSRERIRQLQELALIKLRRKLMSDTEGSPEPNRTKAVRNVAKRLKTIFRRIPKKVAGCLVLGEQFTFFLAPMGI